MKKSKLKILILVVLLIFTPFIIKSIFSETVSEINNPDELEGIEDAIIIRGIEHSSSDSAGNYESENSDGIIIYNNSFEIKDNEIKENIIEDLKKQDRKWHLTPHRIRDGENLWLIAKKYNTDYKLIIKANDFKNPDKLDPGNTILIPNKMGVVHKVIENDTLYRISKIYGVKKDRIVAYNSIKNDLIRKGQDLFIPDAIKPSPKIADNNKTAENTDRKPSKQENNYADSQDKQRMRFAWPLTGKISSAFGKRTDPITNKPKFHCGLDICADIDTPVKASADGKAIFSGWKKGYGRVVILKHDKGYITVYAHNKNNMIKTGDSVEKEQTIALSGMSGAVTGPHLHFEIRKYLTPLNPLRFLE